MTRLLLVAAHPDDETIGASVLMAAACEVLVVHATDGVPEDARFVPEPFVARGDEYKAIRRWELLRALSHVPASVRAVSVGLGDQRAVFGLSELSLAILDAMGSFEPDLLVCHALEGGHPDHDAVALATWCALRRRVRGGGVLPRVQEMGVYHAAPRRASGRDTAIPGALTWCSLAPSFDLPAAAIHLDDGQRTRKKEMLACFASQAPVLADVPHDRESLRTLPHERLVAPDLFQRLLAGRPYEGPLWYEQLQFRLDWDGFVRAAKEGLAGMGECG